MLSDDPVDYRNATLCNARPGPGLSMPMTPEPRSPAMMYVSKRAPLSMSRTWTSFPVCAYQDVHTELNRHVVDQSGGAHPGSGEHPTDA
jgi:hypothetical protein